MSIIGFGEILLRLSPPEHGALNSASSLAIHVGGCEANTLATLASLGLDASLISALPLNALGELALSRLRMSGLDCRWIARNAGRMGLYYAEAGFGARPGQVEYDRAHSAIHALKLADLDLDALFANRKWFYLSGITLALSDELRAHAVYLAAQAKQRGVKLAFDVNYRAKLWDYRTARPILRAMAEQADLLFAGAADMAGLFDAQETATGPEALCQAWRTLSQQLGPRHFAATERQPIRYDQHGYQGFYLSPQGEFAASPPMTLQIMERVGGGDAFAAGMLYAITQGASATRCAQFATACAALKHSLPGDHALIRVADIDALLRTAAGSDLQR